VLENCLDTYVNYVDSFIAHNFTITLFTAQQFTMSKDEQLWLSSGQLGIPVSNSGKQANLQCSTA